LSPYAVSSSIGGRGDHAISDDNSVSVNQFNPLHQYACAQSINNKNSIFDIKPLTLSPTTNTIT